MSNVSTVNHRPSNQPIYAKDAVTPISACAKFKNLFLSLFKKLNESEIKIYGQIKLHRKHELSLNYQEINFLNANPRYCTLTELFLGYTRNNDAHLPTSRFKPEQIFSVKDKSTGQDLFPKISEEIDPKIHESDQSKALLEQLERFGKGKPPSKYY